MHVCFMVLRDLMLSNSLLFHGYVDVAEFVIFVFQAVTIFVTRCGLLSIRLLMDSLSIELNIREYLPIRMGLKE